MIYNLIFLRALLETYLIALVLFLFYRTMSCVTLSCF
nr:MAG TPA: hypothetical protein [Caudoviricetes sp.]